MRFQERDGQILTVVHNYDGVLARRHIKAMFWPDATWRAMEKVLSRLHGAAYLAWPTEQEWKTRPVPESVVWLDWKGIAYIAGRLGLDVKTPAKANENQLRNFAKQLRSQGVRWLREPNWSQLSHDLAVVDVRLAIERAVSSHPTLTLEGWVPESVFRADTDTIKFDYRRRDGTVKKGKRGVIPDGYCVIADEKRRMKGSPHRARFLLELDGATHANPKFGREKIAAGAAYVTSPAYRARFGVDTGRWLIVVDAGETRMRHLMDVTGHTAGDAAGLFFFTTLEATQKANPLTAPIWLKVNWREPGPLIG